MTNPSASRCQRWETRVIHLNITNDPPAPATPAQGAQPAPPLPQNPLFSESYLKEEFPNHYAGPQPSGPEQSQHPAVQLQGFINGLGQEGWEFVGVFPVGQLVMMFFRRPLPPESALPPAEPKSLEPSEAVLQQVLERLERLEASSAAQPSGLPRPSSRASRPRSPRAMSNRTAAVRVLNPYQRQQLPPDPSLPTMHAATALGLRSPGGLLTYGARHGFPPGLVKLVGNGMAAVYLGTEKRQSGGKSTRLWKVLRQSDLPPE